MAPLLAALSALTFGVGDFFGGLSTRRMASVLTTAMAQATGLVLILMLCLVVTGRPDGSDLALGVAAGVAGGVGLVLFYWAMAQGPMSVVAPVSAVMSAVVPIASGVVDGERPSALAIVGIMLGLPAIVLISREPTPVEVVVTERAVATSTPHTPHVPPRFSAVGGLPVVAAALSGLGFGAFFTVLSHTSDDSGLWPIATARSAATVLALGLVLVTRPGRPHPVGLRLAALTGCLDAAGNSFYLLASRQGLLTLVGVVGAMYPASTVLLARFVLHERLARHQVIGLVTAAVAVALIAAA